MLGSKAMAWFEGVFSMSDVLLLLFGTESSALVAAVFDNGDGRPRGINNWFGRRRLKRDDGFSDGTGVDGFSFSFSSNFGSLAFKWSLDGSSSAANGTLVLGTVERERPRILNVGRARVVRCVDDDTWDAVSIAFSSAVFSSDNAGADDGVDFKFKRLRAVWIMKGSIGNRNYKYTGNRTNNGMNTTQTNTINKKKKQ